MPVAHRIEEIRQELSLMAQSLPTAQQLMQAMAKMLHERMLKYNWVGFYMLEPGAQPPMLVLGAFEGAMTPHTRIPLNQGICGAAASSGQTVVVDDVRKDPRYLACSLETKSEIVVPVFVHGQVVGEFPGFFGTWLYSNGSWTNITQANATTVNISDNGNVTGLYQIPVGVWVYDPSSQTWTNITQANADVMAMLG